MKMMRFRFAWLMLATFVTLSSSIFAGQTVSADNVWTRIDDTPIKLTGANRPVEIRSYEAFSLNKSVVKQILASAPEEFSSEPSEVILTLPMPDGSFQRFRIEHSMVVEQGLADKFPELAATYRGQGIDDPTATVRFDMLPSGFHAYIITPRGSVVIDPYSVGDTENYISYRKSEARSNSRFVCEFVGKDFDQAMQPGEFDASQFMTSMAPEVTSGTTLRTYRLALAGNFEYCNAVGGNTVAGCLAAQVLIMNRVNGVYERDLALRMVVVANNNLIVYAGNNTTCPVPGGGSACTAANDPYANSSNDINVNTGNLDTVIGSANYDIGHVFTTGSGGVAQLNSPCGASKGAGTTGLPNPVGDPFAIDYVAHEMGHQWGSNHTFNGNVSNCGGGNRSSSNAFEPGSGITIMGYAGICGNQDLAPNSIDTMHVRSLEVIVAFSQVNNGNACSVQTATGNTPPTVTIPAGTTYNIPKQTPFSLTASATDPNGDTITYDWQQYNAGGGTGAASTVPNSDADGIARPLFRNYVPTTNPTRYFPSLQYIRNNANVPPSTSGSCPSGNCLTGELMSAITRAMTFQVVARDNRAAGGGINTATATVNVDGNSGPFNVTAPNTAVTWAGGSSQTITWSVNNTTAAPVSAANVKISFSTDGGLTFPTTITASTPNDGSETVTIPNVTTTQGRIKVEGAGNIFFDMSDVNFNVNATASNLRAPFDYDGDDKTDLSVFRPGPGEWWYLKSSTGGNAAAAFGTSTDRIAPGDYTGDNKTDFAFWRPSTGQWFVLRSEDFSFYAFPFGASTDTLVPADYDGDNKTDAAVFRPSTNTWYIQKSTGGTDIIGFGASGDKPAVGDFDGDGKADIAIYRPASGQWWIRRSSDAGVVAYAFGTSTDRPVQGDFTGDGKADAAFFRPSTGEWYVLRSENLTFYAFAFGTSGDTPVPGDYDGDNKIDAAVFRSSNSTWYANRSTAGVLIQTFGIAADIPTPSAYVP